MWVSRRWTTTTKMTARGIGVEGETVRPLTTLYYHSPSLPTLYFFSTFLIIIYFILYSQEMRRRLSLFFWSPVLEQVIFQGSTRQSERRSSPHLHIYSPKPHPKITSTTHEKARILDSFFPADSQDRLFQAEETLPMEIVSIHEKQREQDSHPKKRVWNL